MMDTTAHRRLCYTLIGLEVFVVAMAIYGSLSMLLDAEGFGLKEAWLQGSPFSDYRIPGLALLVGVGGTSCVAAMPLLRARVEIGRLLSVGAGLVLVVFELVEFHAIGPRNFQEPLMLAIGLLIAAIGGFLWNDERPRRTRGRRLTYVQ